MRKTVLLCLLACLTAYGCKGDDAKLVGVWTSEQAKLDIKADGTYTLGSAKTIKGQLGGKWTTGSEGISFTMESMDGKLLSQAIDDQVKQLAPNLQANKKAFDEMKAGQLKALTKPQIGTLSPDGMSITIKVTDTKAITFTKTKQ